MCGINGHLTNRPSAEVAPVVERMNRALRHRGPDEGGVTDLGFGAIGMRRLSIVDIAHGRQPMESADGRHALVYNGEIYDFDAVRARLESRGARFATRSDTEVLLHTLILDGESGLPRLDGMFGFAFCDRAERTVLLARDTLGIKPLYYHLTPAGDLIFSSELASLLANPAVPRVLDRRSLAMLLHDRYVADPWTMLNDVRQLPPGHVLVWKNGRVDVHAFETLRFRPERHDPSPDAERAAVEELRGILEASVRSQLVADVPVGVFLSGGVDSSTVAACAARHAGRRVQSFSVGFSRREYDESHMARAVARHLDTEHHEVRIEDARFDPATLDLILDHVGQPLGDTSCIPTYAVSRLASRHVKVVLSGDGGDEFFGGYDHMFWAARVRRVGERTPRLLRRLGHAVLSGVAPLAPTAVAERTRRVTKGLELTFHAPDQQFRRMRSLWSREELDTFLAEPVELRDECVEDALDASDLAPEQHAMQMLARTYMPGAILPKVDRMSMAASLEVRVPLLSRRVFEFGARLPLELKVRGRTGKYLLREAGRPWLPEAVYQHKKQGFSIPLQGWFNADFHTLAADLYAPGSPARALFDGELVDRTLARCRTGAGDEARQSETNAATRAWMLVMLGRWMERFEVTA